ncbi:hypothetical protein ACQCVK_12955 [Rossellomorea vietnamensis]|uniref:hypothetical protein n=1 Tax=Rossellomorea vietnamensis TaxID=218284 RepID=UPI003CEBFBE4
MNPAGIMAAFFPAAIARQNLTKKPHKNLDFLKGFAGVLCLYFRDQVGLIIVADMSYPAGLAGW